jgi:branched-chain amino acid transport system substrate-binding protein
MCTREPLNDVHDYRSLILRIKKSNPSIIILASYPVEGAIFLKQAREMGVTVPVIGTVALLGAKNFFNLAGIGAENLYVISPSPQTLTVADPSVTYFVTEYEKQYSVTPSSTELYSARAFDAVRLISNARSLCVEKDSSCLQEVLTNTKNFIGPSGTISFDQYGDIQSSFTLLNAHQGKFIE